MKLKLCLIHRTCSKTPRTRTRPNQKEMVYLWNPAQIIKVWLNDNPSINAAAQEKLPYAACVRHSVTMCASVCVCVCVLVQVCVWDSGPWGFWPWHSSVPFSFPYPLRAAAQPPVTQPVWASPCLIFFAAKYLIFRFPSLSCLFCVSSLSRVTSLPAALSESLPQNSD